MFELFECVDFLVKSFAEILVVGVSFGEDFESNSLFGVFMNRFVNRAHAALAENTDDFIRSKLF